MAQMVKMSRTSHFTKAFHTLINQWYYSAEIFDQLWFNNQQHELSHTFAMSHATSNASMLCNRAVLFA